MASISDYLELELLDHVLGNGAYTPPTIYVGLSTASPDDDASGLAEPSGSGYARKAFATWNTAASRAITNNGIITFAQASGSWGTITYYAIFDDPTAGHMLGWGALSTSKDVVSGNTPSIADTEISLSFSSGGFSTYLANELLDHVFGNGSYTPPTIYVGLSTANPGDDASGLAEPSGGSYARKAHSAWDVASAGATENTGTLAFDSATGSWGLITYVALFDDPTAGHMLLYSTATPNQTPANGDTVQYVDGALDITLD